VARTKAVKIEDDVRRVLRTAEVSGAEVRLAGQIPRDLYLRVAKVLKALGGKWSKKAGATVFPHDAEEALAAALSDGEAVDVKRTMGQFFTPPCLADQMARMVHGAGDYVLEPSAGEGALAEAISGLTGVDVFCVEKDPRLFGVLQRKGFQAVCADFLELRLSAVWDAVVMNPPFSGGQDVAHVRRAFELLRLGGRLVAVMSPHWTFAVDKASKEFRAWAAGKLGEQEELPAGTFKDSGTDVRAVLVTMQKAPE
jgi:predicted RNA methylase